MSAKQPIQNNINFLGRGAYGTVIKDGNTAVKKFLKLHHQIREVAVTLYMRDSPFILAMLSYDLESMTMTTVLHNCSLRTILNTNSLIDRDKIKVFCDILYGIHHCHSRNIVHADLKPSNILVNLSRERIECWIADMGLSSSNKYARSDLTTPMYREKYKDKPSFTLEDKKKGDLYALAIIGLNLHGIVLRDVLPKESIVKIIQDEIISKSRIKGIINMGKIMKSFILDDSQYNSAESALVLFECKVVPFGAPPIKDYPNNLTEPMTNYIVSQLKILTSGGIRRGHRAAMVLIDMLNCPTCPKIVVDEYPLYISAIGLLYSSIFGKSTYKIDVALKTLDKKWTEKDILRAVKVFLDCKHCLDFTMSSLCNMDENSK